jgi:hypothetical protein
MGVAAVMVAVARAASSVLVGVAAGKKAAALVVTIVVKLTGAAMAVMYSSCAKDRSQ